MNDWQQALSELTLSASEKELVQRFRDNPHSRSFLAVAEILIRHRSYHQAGFLLQQGIGAHPAYSVARIVLAELFYQQGLFDEAWRVLDESPVSLRNNKSAQIISFKLALARGDADYLAVLSQDMQARNQFDPYTHDWMRRLESENFIDLQVEYLDSLKAKGLSFDASYYPSQSDKQASIGQVDRDSNTLSDESDEFSQVPEVRREQRIEGFFVVPVKEIFLHRRSEGRDSPDPSRMDPMTLARVYKRQGHLEKAMEVIRRLLYMAPNNELLKKEVAELEALREEQKRKERDYDPELADRLDAARDIDKKIATLNDLLEVLENHDTEADI